MPKRFRNAIFTLNGYKPEWRDEILSDPRLSYGVIGYEVGELGNHHHQGYLEFKGQLHFDVVRRLLYNMAHIEARTKGTALTASNYCKKGEQPKSEWEQFGITGPNFGKNADFLEVGVLSTQGSRSDLDAPCEMIQAGASMREVAQKFPIAYVKYTRGLHALQAILIEPRCTVPTVTVLYGPTGTGKTHLAKFSMLNNPFIWRPTMKHWFNGYEGQTDALIEEYRGQWSFDMLLCVLDRYDCPVEYKGGIIQFAATNIVITSPKHPKLWYPYLDEDDSYEQLARRITTIFHVPEKNACNEV